MRFICVLTLTVVAPTRSFQGMELGAAEHHKARTLHPVLSPRTEHRYDIDPPILVRDTKHD